MPSQNADVFLRKSSGLVKAASVWDVFIFNAGLISVGIGVLYTHLYGPPNYPGGNIGIASLIATVAMLLVGAGMWSWAVTIPRSGAIYVYASRGAHPALGFALGLVDGCCWLFYNAVAAVLFSTAGLAPMAMALYLNTGNSTFLNCAQWLETPAVSASLGTLLIVFCGVALLLGMRRFFRLQKIMFAVAVVGTITLLYVLLSHGVDDLRPQLAKLFPTVDQPHESLISRASTAGLPVHPLNWWQTLRMSVWPFLPLIGGAFSIAIGGEIRDVRRGQGIGILGAIGLCGLVFAFIGWLSYASFGTGFQEAVTYLHQIHDPQGIPATPYFSTLVALLCGSVPLTIVVCLGFIAWIYFWIPGMLAYAERIMLAMSFDRVAPAALGSVNDRFHTPHVAIAVSVVISVVLTWLYACTSFFNTLIFILAATIAWFVTAVVGIVFPWSRKTLWQASPLAERSWLNLPMISVLNALSALGLSVMGVLLSMDPVAAGHDVKSVTTVLGTFVVGLALYAYMYRLRRSQGIDIGLAFKEIPIE